MKKAFTYSFTLCLICLSIFGKDLTPNPKKTSKLKIPEVPVPMHNDTETLDVLKKLLLKYNDALAKSKYYQQLAEELKKKANTCTENSLKMHQTAQELLQFIVSKMNEHKKALQEHKNNSLKAIEASSKEIGSLPNLENFIENIAANLKK